MRLEAPVFYYCFYSSLTQMLTSSIFFCRTNHLPRLARPAYRLCQPQKTSPQFIDAVDLDAVSPGLNRIAQGPLNEHEGIVDNVYRCRAASPVRCVGPTGSGASRTVTHGCAWRYRGCHCRRAAQEIERPRFLKWRLDWDLVSTYTGDPCLPTSRSNFVT